MGAVFCFSGEKFEREILRHIHAPPDGKTSSSLSQCCTKTQHYSSLFIAQHAYRVVVVVVGCFWWNGARTLNKLTPCAWYCFQLAHRQSDAFNQHLYRHISEHARMTCLLWRERERNSVCVAAHESVPICIQIGFPGALSRRAKPDLLSIRANQME